MTDKFFKVKIPASTSDDYELIATLTGRTMPALMTEALMEYCEAMKTQLLKQAAQRKEWGAKGGQPSHKKKEADNDAGK